MSSGPATSDPQKVLDARPWTISGVLETPCLPFRLQGRARTGFGFAAELADAGAVQPAVPCLCGAGGLVRNSSQVSAGKG